VSHPADGRRGGVGVDVEPADADDLAGDPGDEERLAGPVEAIGAARPVIDQPSYQAQAAGLALGDQGAEALGR
jgi:hypothetical protein